MNAFKLLAVALAVVCSAASAQTSTSGSVGSESLLDLVKAAQAAAAENPDLAILFQGIGDVSKLTEAQLTKLVKDILDVTGVSGSSSGSLSSTAGVAPTPSTTGVVTPTGKSAASSFTVAPAITVAATMTRFARVCLALALFVGATDSSSSSVSSAWEQDCKQWIEQIRAQAAGSAEIKVAQFEAAIAAAVAEGTPEEDLMKLAYDFFDALEQDPNFTGFSEVTKVSTAATEQPASTTAPPAATTDSAAGTSSRTLASVSTVAILVAGYVAL
ncbi:hypothetical protein FI667_g16868, partial [Globisporangium splendens]